MHYVGKCSAWNLTVPISVVHGPENFVIMRYRVSLHQVQVCLDYCQKIELLSHHFYNSNFLEDLLKAKLGLNYDCIRCHCESPV